MILWITASVTSLVPALPPRSFVLTPSRHVCSVAAMMSLAASCSPSQSSISQAVQNVATGLARPMPVMSNAEPWIGSNMEGMVREGSMLAVGATPMEPANAALVCQRRVWGDIVLSRSLRLTGCKVREDVGVEVSGEDSVEGLGMQRHSDSHGIDEHVVHGLSEVRCELSC
jgi:hypothetical protein